VTEVAWYPDRECLVAGRPSFALDRWMKSGYNNSTPASEAVRGFSTPMNEVTQILHAIADGDPVAVSQLLPLVYV
jgi:hypothetical protein